MFTLQDTATDGYASSDSCVCFCAEQGAVDMCALDQYTQVGFLEKCGMLAGVRYVM